MARASTRFAAALAASTVWLGMTAGAHATGPTPKWCDGVRIAAFPGGLQGGVFANNVYNGFRQPELHLGPKVTSYCPFGRSSAVSSIAGAGG
ncbi:MAG: hypothetical protein ACRYGP_14695 [Janthinobacterium lividum]